MTEIRTYPNGEEKFFEIRYNVDKGNLQDVIDILADQRYFSII